MAKEYIIDSILDGKKYYTFDDVLLKPQGSSVVPTSVDTKTYLTKKIKLNIPILSAAMDTVTEETMAIHMAQQGGIGIIHKLLDPAVQADKVRTVKKFQSGIILQPTCVKPKDSIPYVHGLAEKVGYSTFPVTNNGKYNGKVLGLIRKIDYGAKRHHDKKVEDRMTSIKDLKLYIAPPKISLEKANDRLLDNKVSKLLLVDKCNTLRGLITRTDIDKRAKFPNACKDKKDRLIVGAAIGVKKGIKDQTLDYRVDKLRDAEVDVLVIDTAHGHSNNVGYTIDFLRKKYGDDIQIIAGNVATREGTAYLIEKGVDAVKVGVGPGSICTTREMTGVGVPQFSATVLCSSVADSHNIPIITDGGVRNSGDIAKAVAAGASTIMLGQLLAGTPESPGRIISFGGASYKEYSGMGAKSRMEKGSKDRYAQHDVIDRDKLVAEGIEGIVPMKENVEKILFDLVGGLRNSMGYNGCKNIKSFRTGRKEGRIEFLPCSSSTLNENRTSVKEWPSLENRMSKEEEE